MMRKQSRCSMGSFTPDRALRTAGLRSPCGLELVVLGHLVDARPLLLELQEHLLLLRVHLPRISSTTGRWHTADRRKVLHTLHNTQR